MKPTKKNMIALFCLSMFALGLLCLFYAPFGWLKIGGAIVAILNIIVALDYISDSL
jgi:hypothetical protein